MPPLPSRTLSQSEHVAGIAELNNRLDAMNFTLMTGCRRLDAVMPSRSDAALAAAISADLDALGLDDINPNRIRRK